MKTRTRRTLADALAALLLIVLTFGLTCVVGCAGEVIDENINDAETLKELQERDRKRTAELEERRQDEAKVVARINAHVAKQSVELGEQKTHLGSANEKSKTAAAIIANPESTDDQLTAALELNAVAALETEIAEQYNAVAVERNKAIAADLKQLEASNAADAETLRQARRDATTESAVSETLLHRNRAAADRLRLGGAIAGIIPGLGDAFGIPGLGNLIPRRRRDRDAERKIEPVPVPVAQPQPTVAPAVETAATSPDPPVDPVPGGDDPGGGSGPTVGDLTGPTAIALILAALEYKRRQLRAQKEEAKVEAKVDKKLNSRLRAIAKQNGEALPVVADDALSPSASQAG